MLICLDTESPSLRTCIITFLCKKKLSGYSLEASREDSSTFWSAHTGSAGYLVHAVWLPNRSTRVQVLHDAGVCSYAWASFPGHATGSDSSTEGKSRSGILQQTLKLQGCSSSRVLMDLFRGRDYFGGTTIISDELLKCILVPKMTFLYWKLIKILVRNLGRKVKSPKTVAGKSHRWRQITFPHTCSISTAITGFSHSSFQSTNSFLCLLLLVPVLLPARPGGMV